MSVKVKITFFLSGEDLDPDIITIGTKINPTSSWRKGDSIANRNELVRKEGRWEISTGYQESLDVGLQLNLIYEMIVKSKSDFVGLIETHKLHGKFDIVVKMTADTPAFFLGKEFLNLVHDLRADIEVDLYTE